MSGRTPINKKELNLSQISVVTQKINSSMEISELLSSILDLAKKLVNAEGSSLLLTDQMSGELIFYVVTGDKGNIIEGQKIPKGAGIAGYVASTEEPLIVNDVENDPRHFKDTDLKSNFITKSVLCVPIKIKGELMGVLEAVNARDGEGFDKWDQKLLLFLADQAAIAITNRRLYDELKERVDELTLLYDISQSISFATQDDNIYDIILNTISKSLNLEKASIIFNDSNHDRLVVKSSVGLPPVVTGNFEIDTSGSITGYILNNRYPLIVTDINKEPSLPYSKNKSNYNTPSFISIPIQLKNEIIGVLNLADKKNAQSFNFFDLKVASTIATHIAEIFQNQTYHHKIEEQKRLTQEINIACQIHKKILPLIPPEIGGHRMSAFGKPAKEMGGDFYDFFQFEDEKYAIVIADVSGKSIPAALFMGSARNIIRAEARIYNQPSRLLTTANKYIFDDSESGMFVTVFYMLIDCHNNLITYGNAGHNNQLLIKNKSKEVIRLNAKGRALGLDKNSKYEEKVAMFDQGDMALLFTDGVLEYLGNGDIDLGEKELIDIVLKNKYEPDQLVKFFRERLDQKTVEEEFMDDFTFFAIRF
ncbi:MAG: SpoIIE family protein phosphatase [Spirochaetes bacterium]|nr:SpoIIE family protein phosphatase [Spirochaetota bacterium]